MNDDGTEPLTDVEVELVELVEEKDALVLEEDEEPDELEEITVLEVEIDDDEEDEVDVLPFGSNA